MGIPPETSINHKPLPPGRSDWKRTRRPSGENDGSRSSDVSRTASVIARASPPPAGRIHSWPRRSNAIEPSRGDTSKAKRVPSRVTKSTTVESRVEPRRSTCKGRRARPATSPAKATAMIGERMRAVGGGGGTNFYRPSAGASPTGQGLHHPSGTGVARVIAHAVTTCDSASSDRAMRHVTPWRSRCSEALRPRAAAA